MMYWSASSEAACVDQILSASACWSAACGGVNQARCSQMLVRKPIRTSHFDEHFYEQLNSYELLSMEKIYMFGYSGANVPWYPVPGTGTACGFVNLGKDELYYGYGTGKLRSGFLQGG